MGVFKRKTKDGVEGETWYVDYYDPGGKRIIKAVGPTKKEAEAYLGKIKASIREGRFFDIKKGNRVTFNELLDAYIEKVKDTKFYHSTIKFFIPAMRKYFGDKIISEINYKLLEDFRDLRKKTPIHHGTERSDRTVNLELSIIRQAFRKGIKWGMAEGNPFEYADGLFFKLNNRRERALTEEEVKNLIDACPKYLKPIVITAVLTGLRKSDILKLMWKDVDIERGLIRTVEAKTGKTRNIILNQDMITLLRGLSIGGEYVFPNRNGKAFADIRKPFEKALKKAGIKQGKNRKEKIVFHSLRHTCISLLTEKGADTTAVKNYVAHADEKMTAHYTHLSEEYARKTSELLNGLCGVNLLYGNKMETMAPTTRHSPNATA
jgi:integrase